MLAEVGIDLEPVPEPKTPPITNFIGRSDWAGDIFSTRKPGARTGWPCVPPSDFRSGTGRGLPAEFLTKTPLSEQARKDLLRLYEQGTARLLARPVFGRKETAAGEDELPGFSAPRRQSRSASAVVLPSFWRRRFLRRRRCDTGLIRMADGPARIFGACSWNLRRMAFWPNWPGHSMAGRRKAEVRRFISRMATRPSRGCWCAG